MKRVQLSAGKVMPCVSGTLIELFLWTLCLQDILWMQTITVHYCLIACGQRAAESDRVCWRQVSFFSTAMHHHIELVRQ